MSYQYFTHFRGDPYFNMAFDEAMLAYVSKRPGMVCLRLYSWATGTITFGRNQKHDLAYDHERLGATPVIRRMTGGRALFHDPSELTYSIALKRDLSLPSKLMGVGGKFGDIIAGALVEFLNEIGIDADYARRSETGHSIPEFFHKAPCFESHARSEIVSEGRKLIASAACHFEDCILQHGSIKLHGVADHPALKMGNVTDENSLAELSQSDFKRLSSCFLEVISRSLGVRFSSCQPDSALLHDAKVLCQTIQKSSFLVRNIIKHT